MNFLCVEGLDPDLALLNGTSCESFHCQNKGKKEPLALMPLMCMDIENKSNH